MKTEKELKELKEEVGILKRKLAELTEEELSQVIGGMKQKLIPDIILPTDFSPIGSTGWLDQG